MAEMVTQSQSNLSKDDTFLKDVTFEEVKNSKLRIVESQYKQYYKL